jgi:hypothetical protein
VHGSGYLFAVVSYDCSEGGTPQFLRCHRNYGVLPLSIFNQGVLCNLMLRVRHCVECPKCRTRYLPGSSPYNNGSYLMSLTANGSTGWILYCSCSSPRTRSEWRWSELKRYEICGPAYRRGYGSPDEVCVLPKPTPL